MRSKCNATRSYHAIKSYEYSITVSVTEMLFMGFCSQPVAELGRTHY